MASATYETSVFINCPFDSDYEVLFRALVFAVEDCGFEAHCSLEAANAGEVRISKIARLISGCRHGIHDLSRTELHPVHRFPRFNMPLELGLFLGAQWYGSRKQKDKNCLILERRQDDHRNCCSDIAGQDITAHEGDPLKAIAAVRNWLATFRQGIERVPRARAVQERFRRFQAELPGLCEKAGLDFDDLQFVELRTFIEEWAEEHPLPRSEAE
jgi:hypothetical protein